MTYTWRTRWPGIVAQHADRCGAREGRECDCGPLGYRASIEDPETGEPVLSPVLETLAEARAWRHEQREAFDAWRAASDERPTVEGVSEDLLAAAARGSARDRYGRRFETDGLRGLRWALTGHVREELGPMAIAEVRIRHVQALIDRLDAGGLSQARVDAVVDALLALFSYAEERKLIESNPVRALAPPVDDGVPAPEMPPAPVAAAAAIPPTLAHQAPPSIGMLPEQVIWTCLKAVTLVFVLIALVLVAESV